MQTAFTIVYTVSYQVPYDVTSNVLGVVTEDDKHFERLRLISLTPGSPAERHLANKNVLGLRIRTVTDIRMILQDYHDPEEKRGPAYLTGVTILLASLISNCLTSIKSSSANKIMPLQESSGQSLGHLLCKRRWRNHQ